MDITHVPVNVNSLQKPLSHEVPSYYTIFCKAHCIILERTKAHNAGLVQMPSLPVMN